jgi:hypothetical protein
LVQVLVAASAPEKAKMMVQESVLVLALLFASQSAQEWALVLDAR